MTSDVFVYGRPNPAGSDTTPTMSIINFDDLLGRTFLLTMDENGERKRATISEHVKDPCQLGKNIGQQYCWCSLMWLMPLRSLSNCDYELNFYLRLILGPIHSNQVMGTDPVRSYHGTRNFRSNSVNPTYRYQSHD